MEQRSARKVTGIDSGRNTPLARCRSHVAQEIAIYKTCVQVDAETSLVCKVTNGYAAQSDLLTEKDFCQEIHQHFPALLIVNATSVL